MDIRRLRSLPRLFGREKSYSGIRSSRQRFPVCCGCSWRRKLCPSIYIYIFIDEKYFNQIKFCKITVQQVGYRTRRRFRAWLRVGRHLRAPDRNETRAVLYEFRCWYRCRWAKTTTSKRAQNCQAESASQSRAWPWRPKCGIRIDSGSDNKNNSKRRRRVSFYLISARRLSAARLPAPFPKVSLGYSDGLSFLRVLHNATIRSSEIHGNSWADTFLETND